MGTVTERISSSIVKSAKMSTSIRRTSVVKTGRNFSSVSTAMMRPSTSSFVDFIAVLKIGSVVGSPMLAMAFRLWMARSHEFTSVLGLVLRLKAAGI